MVWTTPFTAVANTALTAAQWNSGVRDNLNFLFTAVTQTGKIKASDTIRTATTTLTDDLELASIPLIINTRYRIEVHLEIQSPTAADFRFDMTGPAGYDYRMTGQSPVTANFFNVDQGSANAMSTSGQSGANNDRFPMSGWLTTSSTAGSLTLRWSQNISDAGNTILKTGSHIILTPLP